jgi:orotidine-5'-phosphate decarboxylase
MNKAQLFEQIKYKESYLCIGLDTDIQKIPSFLQREKDPVFEFNRAIIEATADLCVAYKPNIAFYEALGPKGWESLQRTLDVIPKEIFTIADAKRGDIGNTSAMYARTFFETYDFDSITIAPYMGKDSVEPFLGFDDKWVILLALTSNPGSMDFQMIKSEKGTELYKHVLEISQQWGTSDQMMYVVGATRADFLKEIRSLIPEHFLLIPGVGAQGGSLDEVSKFGMNNQCGLLVNATRSIIYASNKKDFAEKAREEALNMQREMKSYLEKYL